MRDLGNKVFNWLNNYCHSRIRQSGNQIIFDNQDFEWVNTIESDWQIIRAEFESIAARIDEIPLFHEISSAQKDISTDEKWKTLTLFVYGNKINSNCEHFPRTCSILNKIPGMKTAMFSILLPGKVIPEHTGPYNSFIRYHLPIYVPQKKENCFIIVNGEKRFWELGKSLIFDDTYPHEVQNNTAEMRVVLFVDFKRPQSFPFSLIINLFTWLIKRSDTAREGVINSNRLSLKL
ncbi:MAG: aspartyl/asparaginyl beta-hydroxylase domain-containing protein [Bacteroidota bacterium]